MNIRSPTYARIILGVSSSSRFGKMVHSLSRFLKFMSAVINCLSSRYTEEVPALVHITICVGFYVMTDSLQLRNYMGLNV